MRNYKYYYKYIFKEEIQSKMPKAVQNSQFVMFIN